MLARPLCQDFLPMIDKAEIDARSEELGAHVANLRRDFVFGCRRLFL